MIYIKKDILRDLLMSVDKKRYSHIVIAKNYISDNYFPIYIERGSSMRDILNVSHGLDLSEKIEGIYNCDLDIEMQINDQNPFYIQVNKRNIELESKALKFATEKHEGQFRKGKSHKPYITHPINVAELIKKYKGNSHAISELVAAAYLHDTIEDTDTTFNELAQEFGIQVASLVKEVTSIDELKKLVGKNVYLAIVMKHMSDWALDIKFCDILSNVSELDDVTYEFKNKFLNEKSYELREMVEKRKLTSTQISIAKDINNEISDQYSTIENSNYDKDEISKLIYSNQNIKYAS